MCSDCLVTKIVSSAVSFVECDHEKLPIVGMRWLSLAVLIFGFLHKIDTLVMVLYAWDNATWGWLVSVRRWCRTVLRGQADSELTEGPHLWSASGLLRQRRQRRQLRQRLLRQLFCCRGTCGMCGWRSAAEQLSMPALRGSKPPKPRSASLRMMPSVSTENLEPFSRSKSAPANIQTVGHTLTAEEAQASALTARLKLIATAVVAVSFFLWLPVNTLECQRIAAVAQDSLACKIRASCCIYGTLVTIAYFAGTVSPLKTGRFERRALLRAVTSTAVLCLPTLHTEVGLGGTAGTGVVLFGAWLGLLHRLPPALSAAGLLTAAVEVLLWPCDLALAIGETTSIRFHRLCFCFHRCNFYRCGSLKSKRPFIQR